MDECCDAKNLEAFARRAEQRMVLKIVLAINATLFFAELLAGFFAGSTALLGDSLDMLGDAMVYGFTLYVLERSERLRAQAALLKGAIMAAFGTIVVWQAVTKMLHPALPAVGVMGLVGLVALAGNGVCFWLLYRHRTDDLNMRSTWLCSRNDLIANVAVIGAAVAVGATRTAWADLLVGLAIAALFLSSAFTVLRDSTLRLRELAAT